MSIEVYVGDLDGQTVVASCPDEGSRDRAAHALMGVAGVPLIATEQGWLVTRADMPEARAARNLQTVPDVAVHQYPISRIEAAAYFGKGVVSHLLSA